MRIYFLKKNYFSHQKLAFIENSIFLLDHKISFSNRYYMFQIAYKWIFSFAEGLCLNHRSYGDNQVLVHKITVSGCVCTGFYRKSFQTESFWQSKYPFIS
jgi:hypothetical protein